MLEVSVKFAKTPSNPFPPFLPAAFPEQLTGKMASAAKVCGGSAVSLRRSLNPFPSRVSIQSVQPPRVWFVPMAVVKRNPKRLKYSAPRFTKEDGLVYVKVDPSGEDSWKLDPVVELLKEGAVGVIPTDTVYAIACDMNSHSAIERLRSVRSPEENGWIIDPVVIADVYGPEGLDFVVDAGVRVADPSTVVDMTGSFPRIIRQGKGPKQPWMVEDDDKDADANKV
ncbi:hypothetical protein RHMOL_Rhmol10G0007800 [Rhododendron molle]|uniref:Uncharacterized protein n=1 Tax=Rhododendron molle TaxID=49168 RepID=A0ACC0LXP4_RHOML|nr:hypothetical protein RHMOL_Rhmol10G0007800 [Rhododendron molle]